MITRDANRMTSDVNGDEGVGTMGCLGGDFRESMEMILGDFKGEPAV